MWQGSRFHGREASAGWSSWFTTFYKAPLKVVGSTETFWSCVGCGGAGFRGPGIWGSGHVGRFVKSDGSGHVGSGFGVDPERFQP